MILQLHPTSKFTYTYACMLGAITKYYTGLGWAAMLPRHEDP